MDDLISRSALLQRIKNSTAEKAVKVLAQVLVNTAPAVDAVEVVRCKDCKCVSDAIKDENGNAHLICTVLMGLPVDPMDYCSMGEREEDG